jgi:hypothetical protein
MTSKLASIVYQLVIYGLMFRRPVEDGRKSQRKNKPRR